MCPGSRMPGVTETLAASSSWRPQSGCGQPCSGLALAASSRSDARNGPTAGRDARSPDSQPGRLPRDTCPAKLWRRCGSGLSCCCWVPARPHPVPCAPRDPAGMFLPQAVDSPLRPQTPASVFWVFYLRYPRELFVNVFERERDGGRVPLCRFSPQVQGLGAGPDTKSGSCNSQQAL